MYEDADNVFMGLTGVYSILYATSDYYIKPHPALANLPTLDLQADGWDAEMSKHAWGVESKSAFFENAWKYSYRMVSRANLFLADLENVTDDVVPEATLKIYESEARCLRGTAYYYLTINFSRVPMLMTPSGTTMRTYIVIVSLTSSLVSAMVLLVMGLLQSSSRQYWTSGT